MSLQVIMKLDARFNDIVMIDCHALVMICHVTAHKKFSVLLLLLLMTEIPLRVGLIFGGQMQCGSTQTDFGVMASGHPVLSHVFVNCCIILSFGAVANHLL